MTDVHKLTLQVRAPRGARDGGKIEIGYYCVVDGHVVPTDETGHPTGDGKRLLNPGGDAKVIAIAMMKARRRNSAVPHGFNDTLHYQKIRY